MKDFAGAPRDNSVIYISLYSRITFPAHLFEQSMGSEN
jgi:hypothetical protein